MVINATTKVKDMETLDIGKASGETKRTIRIHLGNLFVVMTRLQHCVTNNATPSDSLLNERAFFYHSEIVDHLNRLSEYLASAPQLLPTSLIRLRDISLISSRGMFIDSIGAWQQELFAELVIVEEHARDLRAKLSREDLDSLAMLVDTQIDLIDRFQIELIGCKRAADSRTSVREVAAATN